ncbi:MAG TPA: response regulator [Pirellulales bacterium]|nr:response regulator [Pirellulales bacterium]
MMRCAIDGSSALMKRLLLVDDSFSLREHLSKAFKRRGYEVMTAVDYDSAMTLAQQQPFDQAVVDLRMPGPSGLELLRDLRSLQPNIQVVILTGFGSIANTVEAMRLGAVNYVPKPANVDDILAAFRAADPECKANVPALPNHSAERTPSLAQAEWEHMQRVLSDCNGNISQTALRLGITRRSLQRKLRKYAP